MSKYKTAVEIFAKKEYKYGFNSAMAAADVTCLNVGVPMATNIAWSAIEKARSETQRALTSKALKRIKRDLDDGSFRPFNGDGDE